MIIFNSNQKAFTLIDILLTSAIISLLSSIFLFQVSEAKRKADDSHMKVEAQQVSNAIALYKNDNNGKVPLLVTAASGSLYPETSQTYKDTMQLLVAGGYIPEIPKSPDGQSYTYATDANNNAFFAFKLKQGNVSGNRKNSCSVAVTSSGGVKTFTGCTPDPGMTCSQVPGVQCFNGFTPWSDIQNNCTCNSQGTIISLNPSVIPAQICSLHIVRCPINPPPGPPGGPPQPKGAIVWAGNVPLYMCTYTMSNTSNIPACNGSSNSDYCQCI